MRIGSRLIEQTVANGKMSHAVQWTKPLIIIIKHGITAIKNYHIYREIIAIFLDSISSRIPNANRHNEAK